MPRQTGHRAPLLWLVAPLIAGIIAGQIGRIAPLGVQLGLALAAAIAAAIASWRDRRGWSASLIAAMFLAGSASYQLHRARLEAWSERPAREAQVQIEIERLFAQNDPRKRSGIARIVGAAPPCSDLVGQLVYFSAFVRRGDPSARRSAILTTTGVLTPLPRDPDPNSFEGYLASSGINFRLTRARFLHDDRPQLAYYRFCDQAADRFDAILGLGIAEKRPALAGLLRAMMLGKTSDLTEEQHTIFMQSGTMHLFAISGLNIAVIALSMDTLLLLLRLPRWARFAIAVPLLWLFVDITGAAPSAVRAFAMSVFFQSALVLRRPANPLAALVASAVAVLLVAPLQLFSASFLMSYGIVVALLVLGVPLGEFWLGRWTPYRHVPEATWTRPQKAVAKIWRSLVPTLAIGVATTLVSMITSVQFFQLLTPGALVANLILIPSASLVTVGGFAALLCGLAGFGGGAALCNHAAAVVLWAIEALVRQSVQLPWTFVRAEFRAPWIGNTALLVLMTVLLAGYSFRWHRTRGGWWPPFAVVAITLLFGVRLG